MPMDRGFRRILLFETPADKGNSKRWETLVNDLFEVIYPLILLMNVKYQVVNPF
jgi:hypothetical protein